MSLRRDALWTALDIFVTAGLSFGFRLVAARILSPNDFGLAATALTVLALLQVFNDFGLTSALIQREQNRMTSSLIHTTFTASLLISVALTALVVFWLGAQAAAFFNEAAVQPLLTGMSLSLLPAPFTTVASAVLLRERKFRPVAVARTIATTISVFVALLALFVWNSPWAIVIQAVSASVLTAVALTWSAGWHFGLKLSRSDLRDVFGFSLLVLAGDLAVSVSANAGVLILGRMLSLSDAGMYSLATYMTDTVRRALSSILNRVTFVHYATIRTDLTEVRRSYLSALQWNCRLVFPVMTCFALFGPPLLVHFLGETWHAMQTVVPWLCVSVMITAAGGGFATLYRGLGLPGRDLYLYAMTTVCLLLPGMYLGAWWAGPTGVAAATAGTRFASNLVRQALLDRLVGRTAMSVAKIVARTLLLQAPIFACWLVSYLFVAEENWTIQVLLMVLGLVIYGLIELPRVFPSQAKRIAPWLYGRTP